MLCIFQGFAAGGGGTDNNYRGQSGGYQNDSKQRDSGSGGYQRENSRDSDSYGGSGRKYYI